MMWVYARFPVLEETERPDASPGTTAAMANTTGASIVDSSGIHPLFASFYSPDARLLVANTIEVALLSRATGTTVALDDQDVGNACFELEVVHEQWTHYPLERRFAEKKPEDTPHSWFNTSKKAPGNWYWARSGPGTPFPWTVVGGISQNSLQQVPRSKPVASLAGSGPPDDESFEKGRKEGCTLREFRPYLLHAEPLVEVGNHLIGVRYDKGVLRFHPVGRVQRIHIPD